MKRARSLAQHEDFVAELHAMLMSLDIEQAKAFHLRWNPGLPLPSDATVEVGMHKARTAAVTLPEEAREFSRRWLAERDYQPWG